MGKLLRQAQSTVRAGRGGGTERPSGTQIMTVTGGSRPLVVSFGPYVARLA